MNIVRETPARLYSLDGLRGVMCIGIALYHYIPYYFSAGDAAYEVSRYFACFTDIFFVFGGFFSASIVERRAFNFQVYRTFLAKKLARLYPLHFVTLLFYSAIALAVTLDAAHPKNPQRYDLASFVPHLSLTHSLGFGDFATFNYPSWAVSAIFGCCLLLPALRTTRMFSSVNAAIVVALAVALAVSMAVSDSLGVRLTNVQEASFGVARCIPSFVFGVLLSRNRHVRIPKFVAATAFALAAILLFGRGEPIAGVERLLLVYMLVSSIVAMDVAAMYSPLRTKMIRRISRYSFGIYLIHGIVATVLFQVLSPKITGLPNIGFGNANPFGAYSLVVVGLVITICLAALSLKTIEPYGERIVLRLLDRKTV